MDSHDRVDNGDGTMGSQQEAPSLCAKSCGFFGTPATYNLCSKCYKDYLEEEITKALTQTPSMHSPDESINTTSNPFPWVSENTSDSTVSSTDDAWILKNRCQCCKKKMGLMGFGCRCGGLFCGRHRYPEAHSCTFEFKAIGRVALAKENPVCKADRLHKI